MFLNPTDVALELVNTDHMHLELQLLEKDIFKIKKGQKIQFEIPDASGEKNGVTHFQKKEVMVGQEENGFVPILNADNLEGKQNILIQGAFNLINEE